MLRAKAGASTATAFRHALKATAVVLVSVAAMTGLGSATIRVRLFAGLRDAAGWSEQEWPIDLARSPEAVWQQLQLDGDLQTVRVAINHAFAAADEPLQAGDELAFLPPISGG
jgi:molybdopterin synthase sulfur carrier subunit